MDYLIRRVKAEEIENAIALAYKTFLEFEAPDYGEEGVATFRRDIVENREFIGKCRAGVNRIWGAFDGGKIVGLIGMRGQSHITIVFVDKDYHRRGIGTAIFNSLVADVKRDNPDVKKLTLNSAPFGKPFYLKLGFTPTDTEQLKNGIRYTPMEYSL